MSFTLVKKSIGLYVGLTGVTLGLTWLFLGSRTVMSIGGSCGSGGPYVIGVPCPAGIPIIMTGGILGGIVCLGLYLWANFDAGPRFGMFMWPALFLSLGWNFAEFGFGEPTNAAFILCAVMFILMGAFPLLSLRDKKVVRRVFWGDPAPATVNLLGEAATPVAVRQSPNPDTGSMAPGDADSVVVALERLTALRDKGALTEAEYAAAKSRVLGDV